MELTLCTVASVCDRATLFVYIRAVTIEHRMYFCVLPERLNVDDRL